jgi:nitrogenase molybdenum-iron protein NifN
MLSKEVILNLFQEETSGTEETKTTKTKTKKMATKTFTSTRNACKLCTPLGASLVFKGIEGCVPIIHGSQGCATYIRRYMISHFKEPVDIASSNFSEESTIFGGNKNFCDGINNLVSQYNPDVIGIASTCLSETIGENIPMLIDEYKTLKGSEPIPHFVHASTPSYQGTHAAGFHDTVLATVKAFAKKGETGTHVNIFPGMISPTDIRHLKEILDAFGLSYVLFPDYSDTLDNTHWEEYKLISPGGTTVEGLMKTGSAMASIELGTLFNQDVGKSANNILTAGRYLEENFSVPCHQTPMPMGIDATDRFFSILEKLSGKTTPKYLTMERGRLIDAYIDGHKYLFGKRAVIYGEEDLVLGMISFLEEIGTDTVLAGSGGESNKLKKEVAKIAPQKSLSMQVINGLDFEQINEICDELSPDIFLGNSKGYYIARKLGKPLVRIGFPIHDRFGGQRVQLLCYRGTQQFFDRIVNALISYKQENSPVGYKYI